MINSKSNQTFLLCQFSSYWESMKFVLIFGVATSLHIVHRSLSYDATSKLKFQVCITSKNPTNKLKFFNSFLEQKVNCYYLFITKYYF